MSTGTDHRHRGAGRPLHAQGAGRELPGARGGRRVDEGHRPGDDGRRGDHPAAVRAGRPDRPRRGPGQARARRPRSGARTSSRRRSCAGSSPRAGSASRPGRASSRTRGPTPGGTRARSSSRPAIRIAIAWLDRPPANSIAPEVVQALQKVWDAVNGSGRSERSCSPRPTRCCSAPAPTSRRSRRWTPTAARQLLDQMHALLREMETLEHRHDRRGQRARVRRRLRAGDGLRLPDRRRVGDLRPARDQPRDHPRVRRHAAAAAAGRRGQGARDEPDRRSDHRRGGVRARARDPRGPDHELLDTALAWARKLAGQAPLAIEQIKTRVRRWRPRRWDRGREAGLRARRSHPRTRAEGIARVPGKADRRSSPGK